MPTAETSRKILEFSRYVELNPAINNAFELYRAWKTTSGDSLRKDTYLETFRDARNIPHKYQPQHVRPGYAIDISKISEAKKEQPFKFRYSVKLGYEITKITLKNGKTVERYVKDENGKKIPVIRDVVSNREIGKDITKEEIIAKAIDRAEQEKYPVRICKPKIVVIIKARE